MELILTFLLALPLLFFSSNSLDVSSRITDTYENRKLVEYFDMDNNAFKLKLVGPTTTQWIVHPECCMVLNGHIPSNKITFDKTDSNYLYVNGRTFAIVPTDKDTSFVSKPVEGQKVQDEVVLRFSEKQIISGISEIFDLAKKLKLPSKPKISVTITSRPSQYSFYWIAGVTEYIADSDKNGHLITHALYRIDDRDGIVEKYDVNGAYQNTGKIIKAF